MTAPPGRLLGIDYGRVRIGLALSDPLRVSVRPFGHVRRSSDAQAAAVVAAVAKREAVAALVIGLPVHAHGAAGRSAAWSRAFAARVAAAAALPVHEVDERHTSAEAEVELRAAGRWPAPPGEVDALAAVIVLRRFLAGG